MVEKRKGLNTGVIVAIATAVAVGGGGYAALNMGGSETASNPAPAEPASAADPTVGVQALPNADPATPPAPLTPMQPGAATVSPDGSITFIDESLTFSATFPKGAPDDPVLNALRADAQAYLDKFKGQARADYEERRKQGAIEMSWDVEVKWAYTAKAGGIVSLAGHAEEFTGGAHGMNLTDTLIARAATGEKITLAQMLNPGQSPSPAITIAVCEALKAAKLKAINAATIFDEPIVCAGTKSNLKIDAAKFALAPSTDADKFGGLIVYFDPYAVGSYAEGAYTLTIPQDVFREDLRAAYKPLFAGGISNTPPT